MSFRRRDRLQVLFRSFALQGSWNFPQMQGLGFYFALAPWLRKKSGTGDGKGLRRHLGYFNTNPYMATYVLGAVARLEEEGKRDESVAVRTNLMGPLGAIGDGLYWAGLRPLCILGAMVVAMFNAWAAPVFFLVSYNTVHIMDRWSYLNLGYDNAHNAIEGALSLKDRSLGRAARKLILPLAGFLLGMVAFGTRTPGNALLIFAIGLVLFQRRWRSPAVLATLVAFGALLGYLGIRAGVPWSV